MFRQCAAIAAHYHLTDVFDNLIISLCKLSSLLAEEVTKLIIVLFDVTFPGFSQFSSHGLQQYKITTMCTHIVLIMS